MPLDRSRIIANTATWQERSAPQSVLQPAVPVEARIQWQDGTESVVQALAKAHNEHAVEVSFAHPETLRRYQQIWLRRADVRAASAPRLPHDDQDHGAP